MSNRQTFALNANYTQTEGTSLLSGVQVLVRLPLRKGVNCGGILPRICPNNALCSGSLPDTAYDNIA
jgi:hypothetical protein